jgi:hypothetical protein
MESNVEINTSDHEIQVDEPNFDDSNLSIEAFDESADDEDVIDHSQDFEDGQNDLTGPAGRRLRPRAKKSVSNVSFS